jgi:hypothetical protein
MRGSLLTEHKLVLQQFAGTLEGRALVEAAAEASGVPVSEITSLIVRLPEMDFYAPFREHRMTWRATGDVAVVATVDANDYRVRGFTVAGRPFAYNVREGAPAHPVLILHPAEQKSRRINPQPAQPGEVIQDMGDGELSGSIVRILPDGSTRIIELADVTKTPTLLNLECDPDIYALTSCEPGGGEGGDGGGGGGSNGPTYLTYYKIYFSDVGGSAEIEWKTVFYQNGSTLFGGEQKLRIEGVEEDEDNYPDSPGRIISTYAAREGTSDALHIWVTETDWGADDEMGSNNLNYLGRGQNRNIMDGNNNNAVFATNWTPVY